MTLEHPKWGRLEVDTLSTMQSSCSQVSRNLAVSLIEDRLRERKVETMTLEHKTELFTWISSGLKHVFAPCQAG